MLGPHGCSLAQEEKSDRERWQHLADLADFALAMKDTLTNINNQSFNNFMLRIGEASGLASSCCALSPCGGVGGWAQRGAQAWGHPRRLGWGESHAASWKGRRGLEFQLIKPKIGGNAGQPSLSHAVPESSWA